MRRYTLVCEERHVEQIERLAVRYNLTEQEVLRQLVDAGLEVIEQEDGQEDGHGQKRGHQHERV